MNILFSLKKSILILSIAPFLFAGLYADQSSLIARGGEHRAEENHPAARHDLNHPGNLNHGMENRGAFNRGAEAGAIEGAGAGAGVAQPVYVNPTQPQYVLPTQTNTTPATTPQ